MSGGFAYGASPRCEGRHIRGNLGLVCVKTKTHRRREAPETGACKHVKKGSRCVLTLWQTWQRPTLPRLKTKYHRRWGVSRPSSEWDRVQPPRNNHQVSKRVKQTGLGFYRRILTAHPERTPRCAPAITRSQRLAMATLEPTRALPRELRAQGPDEHCLMRAIKPIELLVPVSSTPCGASTPGLSTWWSSTALKGVLVSRWVSRLDAFSGYPVRT